MADSPGQRLALFRKSLGLNQRDFAARLGFSPGRIGSIESGSAAPSRSFLERLAKEFEVSSDWLLQGIGEMQRVRRPEFDIGLGDISGEELRKMVEEHYSRKQIAQNFRFIPRMELSVSAGSGLVPVKNEYSDALAFSSDWLKKNSVNADLSVLVSVKGDSMAPQIPDGALVLVHLSEKRVEHDAVYAFSRGDASFIKRLVPSSKDKSGRPEAIAITSNNPAYQTEYVTGRDLNELHIVGRVRCVMTTL